MFALVVLVSVTTAVYGAHHPHTTTTTTTPKPKTDHELIQDLLSENSQLKSDFSLVSRNLEDLTRQVMLQQTYVEERTRSDGSSGLKQVRNVNDGTKPYYTVSHAAGGVAGLHEHANNIRTVGMGELNVVLNGLEFRTRHNDYRLRKPANNRNYNQVEDIKYPDVPPAVLAKHTVAEQITEMREWFKAFKNQDHSVRDYRKYFKPVLTYMEGGWTTNTKTLEEPFFSDRHHIDADSWFDLQDKVRFTSYTGSKSTLENFAYLPTTIINVHNGTPEYAQWNYRIAAHPLSVDVPFNAFEMVDDVSERMKRKTSMTTFNNTRKARFYVRDHIPMTKQALNKYRDRSYHWGALDDWMYEVPGKDNYPGDIEGDAVHIHSTYTNKIPLNTARYHRWYKMLEKDAMGQTVNHRGFSDPNLFVAETTNPKISALSIRTCKKVRHIHHHQPVQNCTNHSARVTYAVPLEIVYMTPLLSWNPYNLHHIHATSGPAITPIMRGPHGNRNGSLTNVDFAYNGTHDKLFYHTPTEFFSSTGSVDHDKADTAKGAIGVLDHHNTIRKVVASGNRIIIPNIEGVGKVRTRWPIVPLHAEGEQTRKELEALKDMVMRMPTYANLFEELPTSTARANALFMETEHMLKFAATTRDPPGLHDHDLQIHQYDLEEMKKGHTVRGLLSSISNAHQHSVDIRMNGTDIIMVSCDGMKQCWDGHDIHLTQVS